MDSIHILRGFKSFQLCTLTFFSLFSKAVGQWYSHYLQLFVRSANGDDKIVSLVTCGCHRLVNVSRLNGTYCTVRPSDKKVNDT